MQKWEYLVVEINDDKVSRVNDQDISFSDREDTGSGYLQKKGDEGWELVAVIGTSLPLQRLYFKRPKP